MTLEELDQLQEDTRRLARVDDRVGHHMAIAVIEIARQLVIMNGMLAGGARPAAKAAAAGKGKKK
ncbi:MAG TPA: hypothetical protein VFA60_03490 [Terriglobales bacterium]|jgi:hypothetical protein|nr:hypothetical protein [Terriglobales bacterium]